MYVDSSVVVKLYVAEPDSAECEALIGNESLASSELLYGELYSALLAKERAHEISAAHRERVWTLVEEHLMGHRLHLLPLNGDVIRAVPEVMQSVHPDVPLRTLDAIHLATFLSVDAGPLFTKDKRMLDAAKRLNLPLAV